MNQCEVSEGVKPPVTLNVTPRPETESDSQINITCHLCLFFSLSTEKQSSLQVDGTAKHKYMTLTGATVLLMGFVEGCTNNNLSLSNTTSAVHCQRNALIHWVFGSFVSRVWDTLGCGCPWESCHGPVLWDYTHVGTHFDSWAASSATEYQNSV